MSYPDSKEVIYIINSFRGKGHDPSILDSYWFLDELKSFERQFSEYMKLQVQINTDYSKKASELIKMISGKENANIINFNYTKPFSNLGKVVSISNVHGTIADRNIIFGIDLTEDLTLDAHIFTKTHRKMLQKNSVSSLPGGINVIKFYGHSLGSADYSYFQSIFDHYNLYGDDLDLSHYRTGDKPVVLQFYFTVFNKDKKLAIKRNAADSVYKLITTYGNSFDNKDKGRNLLHKLLLEGRVQIIFLDNI